MCVRAHSTVPRGITHKFSNIAKATRIAQATQSQTYRNTARHNSEGSSVLKQPPRFKLRMLLQYMYCPIKTI